MQDRHEAQDQDRLFDRVHNDLDQIHAAALPFSGDRDRVAVAMEQLNECERDINAGEYERRRFDQTVASIQRVIELNHLTDQSRNYLTDDVRDLTRLQTRLERY